MTNTAPYREQYDRMKRWYERFSAINQGRLHDTPSDNYLDEIYAFFQNCYHLKDWIKNDGTVAAHIQQSIESYINETYINSEQPLKLCADICNSLKHLRLDSSRSGESPAFGRKQFAVGLGPGLPTTISLRYEVDTSSGSLDAFSLATDCVTAWDNFLRTNELL